MDCRVYPKVLFLLLIIASFSLYGQGHSFFSEDSRNHALVSTAAISTINNEVPFWMRTNQYGSIPLDGTSGNLIGSFYHDYKNNHEADKWYTNKWDWGIGFQGRLNMGNAFRGQLIEAYAKLKYSIFQVKLGRSKDITGLVDTMLSSGAFAVSGNAPGIPKLEISIPEYWNIPGTKALIALKGNFAMGYMGKIQLRRVDKEIQTFYHESSLYGRIGKPLWKVKFYGGFNHQVTFGHEKEYLGPSYNLNAFNTVFYVITGKTYGDASITASKIGNHIGSLDQGISIDFETSTLTGYHQFFYDVGGLYHLSNLKDGLWGISLTNKNKNSITKLGWRKFLLEFLYSKSQGGELREHPTPSGDEDYYNNESYYTGWTNAGQNLGSNFLTNKNYIRNGLPSYKREYIGNNRVMLFHIGAEWYWKQWSITNKFSFSCNYGTYATSPIGNTTGTLRVVQPPPYFTPVNQFSGYIEASRPLKNNLNIGFVLAGDYGDLLYNSLGGMVKLTKTF